MNPAALGALMSGDLGNFLVASTPGGIEAQEARGQAALCAADILPKDSQGHSRADFESLGFKFGLDHDDIFINATLPAGWRKRPSDHSMWSYIDDEKGRERVAIFYKAAFYYRSAHMSLKCRFNYSTTDDGSDKDHWRTCVKDCGTVVYEIGESRRTDLEGRGELGELARGYLNINYPDWTDPLKYWD